MGEEKIMKALFSSPDTRWCCVCKIEKPKLEFYKRKYREDKYCSQCKECAKIEAKKRTITNKEQIKANKRKYYYKHKDKLIAQKKIDYKKNKERYNLNSKRWQLKNFFNLTLEEFQSMILKQENKCAICGRHASEFKVGLSVDHNHTTNKVRELLCSQCNTALGGFREDIEIMNKAIEYLKKHNIEQHET